MDKLKKTLGQILSSTKDLSKIIFDLIKDSVIFILSIIDRKKTLTDAKKNSLATLLSYVFVAFVGFSILKNTGILSFVSSIRIPSFNTSSILDDKNGSQQTSTSKSDCVSVYCSEVEFGSNVPAKYANSITVSWCESSNTTKIATDTTQVRELGEGVSVQSQAASRVLEGTQSEITNNSIIFNTLSTRARWVLNRSNGMLKAYNMNNSAEVLDSYRCAKDNPSM
jgi:hypothetical protein